MMRWLCFLGMTVLAVTGVKAQPGDGLEPMLYNRALTGQVPAQNASSARSGNNIDVFLLDTLHLPFVDDFTRESIKRYDTSLYDSIVLQYARGLFHTQIDTPDVIEGVRDTSYTYVFNTNTNTWDSTANPVIYVYHLDSAAIRQKDQDTLGIDTVWIKPAGRLVNGVLVTDSIEADTIFFNQKDTVFFRWHEDDRVRWTSSSAYINNTFGLQEPTFGVATFEGLDSLGQPYAANFNPNAYGEADVFTSAPINLLSRPFGGIYTNADSLYFSFFYQPQGYGDSLEEGDSLVLDFYSIDDNRWIQQWKAEGTTVRPFEQVMIKIENGIFFRDGFRFRFRNYANISGNFDHWNIDYVRIGENRTFADTTIDDVAFVGQGRSLLREYSQMPWQHYLQDTTLYVSDTVGNRSFNLSPSNKLVLYQIRVLDRQDAQLFETDINQNVEPVFQSRTYVNKFIETSPFRFPNNEPSLRNTFRVQNVLNTQPDDNASNDTLTYRQDFGTFYAYDDGTSEITYYLVGPGAELAIEYNLQVVDSLRAINIFFPRTLENITQRLFRLKIWTGSDQFPGPINVLYESALLNPRYSVGRNLVVRHEIDPPIPVTGKIFVGFQQSTDRIFVGFDRNFNSRKKIFYNTEGFWQNGSFDGSVMIHPEFDSVYYPWPVHVEEQVPEANEWQLYPNPARNEVVLNVPTSGTLHIFDLTGRVQWEQVLSPGINRIETTRWQRGTYLVRWMNEAAGTVETRKLILAQ